jgi:hypothetical protein
LKACGKTNIIKMDVNITNGMTVGRSTDNESLCDFLRYLIGQVPSTENGKNKAKKIRSTVRELSNVRFEP